MRTLSVYGIWVHAVAALHHAPQETATAAPKVNLDAREIPEPQKVMGRLPDTAAGEIGIYPPTAEPTPVNIERHREYYTGDGGTLTWVGLDESEFNIITTTSERPNKETAVATITKGVIIDKNEEGGVDVLLSPVVKARLEEIAKEVTPCAPVRRQNAGNSKRQKGPACGLADFVQRVGADEELQSNFAEPLTDQAWSEIDEGYGGDDPAEDPGWEGDGDPGWEEASDEGYFSDDHSGFFEGAEAGEGEGTLETIVFGAEEEAAAIGGLLSGSEAAAAAAVWGGSTLTAASMLAFLWGSLQDGKALLEAQVIPAESIHTVTKTKGDPEATTATSSEGPSCPTPTGEMAGCGGDCVPTSVGNEEAGATGVVDWACSEGETKGCMCNPEYVEIIETYDAEFQKVIDEAPAAIDEERNKPQPKPEPKIECPGDLTNVPSEFFLDQTSKGFCEKVMEDLETSSGPDHYDIKGQKIPTLRRRSPPESIDNYMDYRVSLHYDNQDGECLVGEEDLCRNAYEALVQSPCGQNHGSAGDRMSEEASIDVGCGTFKWFVKKPPGSAPPPQEDPPPEEKPPPEISLGKQECHERHKHPDVLEDEQGQNSGWACNIKAKGKSMKAGDEKILWRNFPASGSGHHTFEISWIKDCDDRIKTQSLEFPLEGDDSLTCTSLMRDNYKKCNNGGAGAFVDVGCLRYDFYSSS